MTGRPLKKTTGGNVEARRTGETSGACKAPPVDIYETDEAIVVEADMPRVEPAGVEVQIDNGLLTILGRVESRPIQGVTQLYEETGPGDYRRAFALDAAIDESRISAVITGGVLTVTLPKAEVKRARRIEVK